MSKIEEWYHTTISQISNWIRNYINDLNDGLFDYIVNGRAKVVSTTFANIINTYNTQYERVKELAMTPDRQIAMMQALNGATPSAISKITNLVGQYGNTTTVQNTQQNMTNVIAKAINTTNGNKNQLVSKMNALLQGKRILDTRTRQPVAVKDFVDAYLMICANDNRQISMDDFQRWAGKDQNVYTLSD